MEIVRKLYAAWERGDYASTEFMAPDIVYFERDAYLDTPPVIEGRDACVKAMAEFASTFQEFKGEIERIADAGDWVVTLTHWQGSGAGSGTSVDLREVVAWKLQDGLAIEGRVFGSWDDALEAAGPTD